MNTSIGRYCFRNRWEEHRYHCNNNGCCGGFPGTPPGPFRLSRNGHTRRLTREPEFRQTDYKLQSAQHYITTYTIVCSFMCTIKPQYNVFVTYKNPRTRPYKIQNNANGMIAGAHTRPSGQSQRIITPPSRKVRVPSTNQSQNPELTNSQNPTRETKE